MLLKPEPLKGLDWLNSVNGYDRELIKNFQQIYSQKLCTTKKAMSSASMMMRCLYGYNVNLNSNNTTLATDIGSKCSPFKPYQKVDQEVTPKVNESDVEVEETVIEDIAKSPKSSSADNFVYTILSGVPIASFTNGGEKLLCLPQILNLMKNVDLDEINGAINTLGIICTECDEESLDILHRHNILPKQATCCGLICLSNAERLLKFFSNTIDPQPNGFQIINNNSLPSEKCCLDSANCHQIRVTHDCFGQQKGILFPLKYSHPNARCIDCLDCGRTMSPSDFVGHTHQDYEERWSETQVCHWGFDSTNWRWYLRLSEDSTRTKLEEDSLNEYLDEIKKRFGGNGTDFPSKKFCYSSTNTTAFTDNHFKSLHLSGAVFQQCVSKINNNSLSSREEKIQLLNGLFHLRQEHLHQINNLITERQQLIEGMLKKPKEKINDENKSEHLLQVIKLKGSFLKKEQKYRKRAASCSSDIGKSEEIRKPILRNSDEEENNVSKKIRVESPLKIECCDSSSKNVIVLDSPYSNPE